MIFRGKEYSLCQNFSVTHSVVVGETPSMKSTKMLHTGRNIPDMLYFVEK